MLSYYFLHSVMSLIIEGMVTSTLCHSGISLKSKESQGVFKLAIQPLLSQQPHPFSFSLPMRKVMGVSCYTN